MLSTHQTDTRLSVQPLAVLRRVFLVLSFPLCIVLSRLFTPKCHFLSQVILILLLAPSKYHNGVPCAALLLVLAAMKYLQHLLKV